MNTGYKNSQRKERKTLLVREAPLNTRILLYLARRERTRANKPHGMTSNTLLTDNEKCKDVNVEITNSDCK